MHIPLRPLHEAPQSPLMDERLCVCGLANTWEVTKRISGHRRVGQQNVQITNNFLDQSWELEEELFSATGNSKADAEAMLNRLEGLRNILALALCPDN